MAGEIIIRKSMSPAQIARVQFSVYAQLRGARYDYKSEDNQGIGDTKWTKDENGKFVPKTSPFGVRDTLEHLRYGCTGNDRRKYGDEWFTNRGMYNFDFGRKYTSEYNVTAYSPAVFAWGRERAAQCYNYDPDYVYMRNDHFHSQCGPTRFNAYNLFKLAPGLPSATETFEYFNLMQWYGYTDANGTTPGLEDYISDSALKAYYNDLKSNNFDFEVVNSQGGKNWRNACAINIRLWAAACNAVKLHPVTGWFDYDSFGTQITQEKPNPPYLFEYDNRSDFVVKLYRVQLNFVPDGAPNPITGVQSYKQVCTPVLHFSAQPEARAWINGYHLGDVDPNTGISPIRQHYLVEIPPIIIED